MLEQTATFQVLVASNSPEAVGYMVLSEPMAQTNRARLQADWVAVHEGIPCPRLIVLPHNAKLMMGGQVIQDSPFSFDEYADKAVTTCSPATLELIDRYNTHVSHIVRALEDVGHHISACQIDKLKKLVYYGKDTALFVPNHAPLPDGHKMYPVVEIDLTHAILGIVSEVEELIKAYVKGITTGEWDHPNLIEEGGDIMWYLPLLAKFCKTTLSVIAQLNNKKLADKAAGRYKTGQFSEDQAINRNEASERTILETAMDHIQPIGVRPHGVPDFGPHQISQTLNKNVFHLIRQCYEPLRGVLEPGFYFWDETGQLGGGPYPTDHEAVTKLEQYAEFLNRPEATGELHPPPQSVTSYSCGDLSRPVFPTNDPPEPK